MVSTQELNLMRDIETMKLSIRQLWLEIDREPDAAARAEMKRVVAEVYVPELKALLWQLERPDA